MPRATLFFLILLFLCHARAEKVRISGLSSLRDDEARLIIGERLQTIEQESATVTRAADAAYIMETLLRYQGFTMASVTGNVENGSIHLHVSEGARYYFGEITIAGIDKKAQKTMRQLFTSTAKKRQLAFAPRVPFLDSDITAGLSYITQEWQSRGHWAATATLTKQQLQPNGDVDFHILINLGAPFLIAPVALEGSIHQEEFLKRILTRYSGIPATAANINEIRRKVIAFYRKRGFTDAVIKLSGQPSEGKFFTTLTVELGTRYTLRKWHINGLKKTLPERVTRRFDGAAGKYYDANRTDKIVRKLLSLGAFSSAQVTTEKSPASSVLDATLLITEAKARSYSGYGGFETFEGAILGAAYADRNLWGRLLQLNAGLEWSLRGVRFDTRIADPYFLGNDIQAGYRYFAVNRDLDIYQKLESGFSIDFTRELTDYDSFLLFLSSSLVNINDPLIQPDILGVTAYNHNRARLTWTHERRNNKVNPSDGWHLQAAGEIGAVLADESTSYLLAEASGSYYIPIQEIHHIALGLRAGMISPATGNLPVDLRYFLGGPASIRSFPQRELGPRNAAGTPFGGEAYWVGNAEYIHSLGGPIKAVSFVDIGTLSQKANDFGLSGIDVAIGIGARIDLPIGPIRIEYGHNMTPDNGEPSGAFHFAIGVAF